MSVRSVATADGLHTPALVERKACAQPPVFPAGLSRAASASSPGAAAGLAGLDASLQLLAQMSPAEAAVAEILAGPAL